ncbi:isochorismatase family protein [Salinactinospora qingdaonensis]|uniref:Isochorismatase-like domain-containing protein n=1 Tax=Salinactinospora qingdaonensis TaxID=702744 RepID=A0ABP7F0Q5_9ACTN
MALPQIEPYPLPTPDTLPANRVSWTPEPDRVALLVHDMQHYFLRPYASGEPPLAGALDNIAALRQVCHAIGAPVIYTAKPGDMAAKERGLERDFWGRGMRAVSEDTDIVAQLRPHDGDVLLVKHRYSAFLGTDLVERMARSGRDQIIITGVYAHIGCLITATDAFMRDLQAFFVADAMADFSAEDHYYAMRYAARRCAVTLPTAALTTTLTRGPARIA